MFFLSFFLSNSCRSFTQLTNYNLKLCFWFGYNFAIRVVCRFLYFFLFSTSTYTAQNILKKLIVTHRTNLLLHKSCSTNKLLTNYKFSLCIILNAGSLPVRVWVCVFWFLRVCCMYVCGCDIWMYASFFSSLKGPFICFLLVSLLWAPNCFSNIWFFVF